MKKRLIIGIIILILGLNWYIRKKSMINAAASLQEKPFNLTSSAFKNNEMIPVAYTCDGHDISPELFWKNIPKGTESFVLICQDPDAPDPAAPVKVWDHWLVYNIPSDVTHFSQGDNVVALGAKEGVGSDPKKPQGYTGPCPPIGTHRYIFTVYALNVATLEVSDEPTKEAVLQAMEGHIIAQAQLIGMYKRR